MRFKFLLALGMMAFLFLSPPLMSAQDWVADEDVENFVKKFNERASHSDVAVIPSESIGTNAVDALPSTRTFSQSHPYTRRSTSSIDWKPDTGDPENCETDSPNKDSFINRSSRLIWKPDPGDVKSTKSTL